MKIYKKIKRSENSTLSKRIFVRANYKLGEYYQYELRKLKEARNYYNNILEMDNREKYLDAQFELLNIAFDLNEFDEAERVLSKIKKLSEQPWFNGRRHYEASLFNFGLALKKNDNYKEAKIKFSSEFKDLEIKAHADFELGSIECCLKEKIRIWKKIPKNTIVGASKKSLFNNLEKILQTESKEKEDVVFNQISEKVNQILNYLFVSSRFESNLAHYTNIEIAKILLSNADQSSKAKFRLNTVKLMNDPMEGELLDFVLKNDIQIDIDQEVFLTCFTLHYDSLNQFRLYGKEKQQEATGISLVIDRGIFTQYPQHDLSLDSFDPRHYRGQYFPLNS